MKILITGGAGFIGWHLAKRLARNNQVIILDNFSNAERESLDANLDIIEGDIRDSQLMKEVLKGVDVVYHMAALLGVERVVGKDAELWDVEIKGTENLLKACISCDVPKILFASSSEVYGHYPSYKLPMSEEDNFEPDTLYGKAKRQGEIMCDWFAEKYGITTKSARYFNVYGPGQGRGSFVIPTFVHSLLNEKNMPIHGDGTQRRDFTFVEDAVEATIRVCEDSLNREVFNIGSGKPISMNELAHLLMIVSEIEVGIDYLPPRRPTDMYSKYADVTKIRRLVGWEATTKPSEGLKSTIEFYACNKADKNLFRSG